MAINYTQVLATPLGPNNIQQYLIALAVFLGVAFALFIFKTMIIHRLKSFFKNTKNDVDDLIIHIASNFGWPVYLVIAMYGALFLITVPAIVNRILFVASLIIVTYYVARALQTIISYVVSKIEENRLEDEPEADTSILHVLGRLVKFLVWVLAFLLILSNLGYNVSTLLAGLGIGGLAIAFALQTIFADLFASISIYFDKPFQRGDYIVVGPDSGVVKHIGIKTTRIQTLQGEELVIANTELTTARVHNFKRMEERRVVFTLGLTYDTSNAKLNKVPKICESVIKKAEHAKFARAHFKSFGDFSLNYEIVYLMTSSDYDDYMNTQQEINLQIKKRFEKEKIDMAFPTQTVVVQK
jgi:small-conductance mechanosensitive channel